MTTEMSVDPTTTSRRTFLKFAVGVPLTGAALAACGSCGPVAGRRRRRRRRRQRRRRHHDVLVPVRPAR